MTAAKPENNQKYSSEITNNSPENISEIFLKYFMFAAKPENNQKYSSEITNNSPDNNSEIFL